MRVLFMGTPDIAAHILRETAAHHDVVGVFCQPDRPVGRKAVITPPPVKVAATELGIPVYQPTKLRDGTAAALVRELAPDVVTVVAYGRILPKEILEAAPHGCVNIHVSLLPRYRGAAPIQHALLNGETVTGVTAMYLAEEMDAGDIIDTVVLPITPEDDAESMFRRSAESGAALLVDVLDRMQSGPVPGTPQNHAEATFAPMLTKALCPIDWSKSAREIIDHVRGLDPWPVATTELDGKRFKIYAVRPIDRKTDKAPGTLLALTKQGLEIACGNGEVLVITQLQADGGKRMAAPDYFRGHPIAL